MDGEADREKSNCFSTISARELCFCLKKYVYLHDMKNKCILQQIRMLVGISKNWLHKKICFATVRTR
jgi:hypothetical protein